MKRKAVFVADRQVRPIWRFFVSSAMVALAYWGIPAVLSVLYHLVGEPRDALAGMLWYSVMLFLALLWIFSILTTLFEGKPLASIGLAFVGRWKSEAAMGMGLGASMIFIVATAERLLGLATFAVAHEPSGKLLTTGFYLCLLFLIAATNEELMFRGYPFQRLVEVLGPAWAVTASSLLFGLMHLGNPFHTQLSTAITILVGIPLSLAYLRTRALWMSIGIHFAWNFFQGYGLGLPVSGIVLRESVFKLEVHGLVWLTGGEYGPEGGLLALVAIVGATLYLSFSKSIYTSEEMKELAYAPTQTEEGSAQAILTSPPSAAQAGPGQRDRR